MLIRKELEKKAQSFIPANTSLSTVSYGGINFLHIDFYYKGLPVVWTQINIEKDELEKEVIELKIADINKKIFSIKSNGSDVIDTIIEFAKYMGARKIFSRIFVKDNFNELNNFYSEKGFSVVHTPKEKSYDSARIFKILKNN